MSSEVMDVKLLQYLIDIDLKQYLMIHMICWLHFIIQKKVFSSLKIICLSLAAPYTVGICIDVLRMARNYTVRLKAL